MNGQCLEPFKVEENYFVQGSSVSVVEVDCVSGEHTVLSTHIVMDVGSSLSPAIDVGQIEGAFTMGYGWLCLEEVLHQPGSGALLSTGPNTYKIPTAACLPQHFHVTLLSSTSEPRAIYSSKVRSLLSKSSTCVHFRNICCVFSLKKTHSSSSHMFERGKSFFYSTQYLVKHSSTVNIDIG